MQRPLNALDLSMLGMHETSQANGHAGFEALSLIWLNRRIDLAELRLAVDQLQARHPWLAGTLRRDWKGAFSWAWDDASRLAITEETLDISERSEVYATAERIISQPRDLYREPGLAFRLLHLRDGSDVLATRVNHALMDHPSSSLVLQELSRLLQGESLPPAAPYQNLAQLHRSQFSFKQRMKAAWNYLTDRRKSKNKRAPRTISEVGTFQGESAGSGMGIVSRAWNEQQTRQWIELQRQLPRMNSESMMILGSAFRAMSDVIPNMDDNDLYRTHIGVDLGMVNARRFIPQNASSVVKIQASPRELRDRKGRVALLSERLMSMLKVKRDLGMLEMISNFRWNYPFIRKISRRIMERSFSLFYAYFVVPRDLAQSFGGIPVRHVSYFAPAWSPVGMTLLVSRFRETMEFQATFLPSLVDRATVEECMDRTLEELVATMHELSEAIEKRVLTHAA